MWVFPFVATVIAAAFAAKLVGQFVARRGPAQLLWAIAMGMFAVASAAVTVGVASGWSTTLYAAYWALGAVLNVAYLAGGELVLLFRRAWVRWVVWLVLIFATAYTVSVLANANMDPDALAVQLPRGLKVFGDGTPAHRLAQLVAYPAYVILLFGTLWSAWKMRGRPELKDRFVGTLLIAVGATVVAAGAAFAATGLLVGFIATLVAGICVMFWGFLRASRPIVVPDAAPVAVNESA
jgi:cation transporter-like permease